MRLTIIHNPQAGERKPTKAQLLRWARKAGYEPVYTSSKRGDLDAAIAAATDGIIVAAGGDGTVRKVALRLAGRGLPLAVLPLGTANNIARAMGVNGAQPHALMKSWAAAERRHFDVGTLDSAGARLQFVEGVGMGWFSEMLAELGPKVKQRRLAARKPRRMRLRKALKDLRAHLATLEAFPAEIKVDRRRFKGRWLLIEALNIRSIGPALALAPWADPGDGKLDVVLVEEDDRKRLLAYIDRRLKGKEGPPTLKVVRGRRVVILTPERPMHVDDKLRAATRPPDGVLPTKGTITDIGLLPGAIEVLVPKLN